MIGLMNYMILTQSGLFKVKNLFENNGITQRFINEMKQGDKIIVVKKNSSQWSRLHDWTEPFEFVLDKRDTKLMHNSADHYETYNVPVLIGEDGTELVVDDGFGIPMVKDYEIYLNYQGYFDKIGESVNEAIRNIKIEAKYIKSYQAFKKKMIQEKPEKLI